MSRRRGAAGPGWFIALGLVIAVQVGFGALVGCALWRLAFG